MTRHPSLVLPLLTLLVSCGRQPSHHSPVPLAGSFIHLARALPRGNLVGIALDSTTGLPIGAAQVVVTDSLELTSVSTVADSLGVFVIRGLTRGEKLLTIRFLGYCPKRLTVTIPPPSGFALLAEVPQAHCESPPGSDVITCAPCP